MPHSVLLTRLHSRANRLVLDNPELLKDIRRTLEEFEAKIIIKTRKVVDGNLRKSRLALPRSLAAPRG